MARASAWYRAEASWCCAKSRRKNRPRSVYGHDAPRNGIAATDTSLAKLVQHVNVEIVAHRDIHDEAWAAESGDCNNGLDGTFVKSAWVIDAYPSSSSSRGAAVVANRRHLVAKKTRLRRYAVRSAKPHGAHPRLHELAVGRPRPIARAPPKLARRASSRFSSWSPIPFGLASFVDQLHSGAVMDANVMEVVERASLAMVG
jgi:hypothetical protein